VATPALDVQTEDPDLGCALADLATACAVMAEAGAGGREPTAASADEAEAPPPPSPPPSRVGRIFRSTAEAVAIEPTQSQPSLPEPVPSDRAAVGDEAS
jgi:hypothetical protein